jgi:hypothetical protein
MHISSRISTKKRLPIKESAFVLSGKKSTAGRQALDGKDKLILPMHHQGEKADEIIWGFGKRRDQIWPTLG